MDSKKMDIVMDVKVQVTVQLGTAQLPMKEIVELSPGSQIQLKQNAKDPVSLLVNGKLIALGEVVVIDDRFGLKITEIVDFNPKQFLKIVFSSANFGKNFSIGVIFHS